MQHQESNLFTPRPCNRTDQTIESCIKQAIKFAEPGITNMAQGMAYWDPPIESLNKVPEILQLGSLIHRYGPIQGLPLLVEELKNKITLKNAITDGRSIMVTAGCNQAFFHVMLATCDVGDEVIQLSPSYFNHTMAIQLCSATPVIVECLETIKSIFNGEEINRSILESNKEEHIESIISKIKSKITNKTKMIALVSPGNPFGAILSAELLIKLQKLTQELGIWLVSDETYEDFIFNDTGEDIRHYSPTGPNVINLYSMSKSYGLAGWRVGYIAYPPSLQSSLDKIQDTNPINVSQFSQRVAFECAKLGNSWVGEKVSTLIKNRQVVWDAIKDFPGSVKTSGALYFMVKMPEGVSDLQGAEYIAKTYKVLVVPCSNCNAPGYIRVSFGNLPFDQCVSASEKLKLALNDIWDSNSKFRLHLKYQ